MLKQVAYNVFIGPLAVPILFEPQHGLLKTGFLPIIPPSVENKSVGGTIGDFFPAKLAAAQPIRYPADPAEYKSRFGIGIRILHLLV